MSESVMRPGDRNPRAAPSNRGCVNNRDGMTDFVFFVDVNDIGIAIPRTPDARRWMVPPNVHANDPCPMWRDHRRNFGKVALGGIEDPPFAHDRNAQRS